MSNENIYDSGSFGKEKGNNQPEKYHDLSLIKGFIFDCIEQNPLSKETEKQCSNQLQSTCSNIFGREFMDGVTENLPKALCFEEKTKERIKKEFKGVMS